MLKRVLTILALTFVFFTNANAGVTYRFSVDNVLGPVAGSIEGTITLDFLTSVSDSGSGAASDVRITSAPAGVPASVEGYVITSWMTQASNNFVVVGGIITDYQFGAAEGSPSAVTDNVLCLNNGPAFSFPAGNVYICGANENFFGNGFTYVYNTGGIGAVSLQQSVPLPGSLLLVLLGLACLRATRRPMR